MSGLHIGHFPYNFGGVIIESLQAEADVGPAGCKEFLAFGLVAIELGRVGRFYEKSSFGWWKEQV